MWRKLKETLKVNLSKDKDKSVIVAGPKVGPGFFPQPNINLWNPNKKHHFVIIEHFYWYDPADFNGRKPCEEEIRAAFTEHFKNGGDGAHMPRVIPLQKFNDKQSKSIS